MPPDVVESAGKHDVELVECGPPAAGAEAAGGGLAGVVDAEIPAAQVDQLDQGLVGGEVTAGLADLAEPLVDAFDHVRGVDDLADLGREGEEGNHLLPGGLPLASDRRKSAADVGV